MSKSLDISDTSAYFYADFFLTEMVTKFRTILATVLAGVITQSSFSQPTQTDTAALPAIWTLQDCIDYAVGNSITLKQRRLNTESVRTDLKTAKAALFPDLWFSTNHSLINRPFRTSGNTVSGTEIISTDAGTSYTGNYGLNASWTLFNGGENRKNIRLQKINEEISELDTRTSVNDIEEDIIQLYIQILYSSEAVNICKNTLQTSTSEYERGLELFSAGSISKAELAQLQAQASSDRYSLVSAESALRDYSLQLKQLMDLDSRDFSISTPDIGDGQVDAIIPDIENVYANALDSRPEIKSGELNIQASDLDIDIVKAGYLPSLSLSAGIGTNHTSGTDFTFAEQIRNGWNNSIGLTLSVPITSKRQNKSAVEKARIQHSISKLELVQAQKELYRKIESLWSDAVSSREQFRAAADKVGSASASYELVCRQFHLGAADAIDLLTEKNNLTIARQEALQAKYMAVLNIQLLKFYNGEKLAL